MSNGFVWLVDRGRLMGDPFCPLLKLEPKEIGIKGNPPLNFTGLLKFGFILNSHWSKP